MAHPVRSPVVAVVTYPWPCCRCCSGYGHAPPYDGHDHPCARCQADQLTIGEGE